jgi:hypothetical protein
MRFSKGMPDVKLPDHVLKLTRALLLGPVSNEPFRYASVVDEVEDTIVSF